MTRGNTGMSGQNQHAGVSASTMNRDDPDSRAPYQTPRQTNPPEMSQKRA